MINVFRSLLALSRFFKFHDGWDNLSDLQDTLEYFKALGAEPEQLAPAVLPLKYRLVTAQQRPLQAYESLWKGGDSR